VAVVFGGIGRCAEGERARMSRAGAGEGHGQNERSQEGSLGSLPRWRRAGDRAALLAVVARARTASRGAASGGKMSGRRVEARGSRRCRGAAGNGGGGAAIEEQSRGSVRGRRREGGSEGLICKK
jgi:hypothetical protein